MPKTEVMKVGFNETTIALANATVDGYIDDFYASIDVNYTIASIELSILADLTVQNAGSDEEIFRFKFRWFEDDGVLNTVMKNIWAAFTDGLTNMETASSYTTVQSLSGVAIITITYSSA